MIKFFLKFSLCLIIFGASASFSAQKKKGSIMESTDIQEIEAFIKNAHPDDMRIFVLKNRIITLKNAEMENRARAAKPMPARPIVEAQSKSAIAQQPVQFTQNEAEAEEFNKLMNETSKEEKEKTLKFLNTLFDQDINGSEAILVVENHTSCNIIIRIQGNKYYNLAVPSHGKNTIVVEKGTYSLKSNFCDATYASTKEIIGNQVVVLNAAYKVSEQQVSSDKNSSTAQFSNVSPTQNSGAKASQ